MRQSPYCPIYSPAGDVSLSYRLVWIGSAGDVGHCVVFGGHEAIAPTWRKQEGAEVELLNAKNVRSRAYEMLGGFLFRLKPLIRFVGYMLPAYFVLTEYYLQTLKNNDRGYYRDCINYISDYFWDVKSIVYFSDWHIPVHHVLLGILGVAIVVSLIYRIQRRQWLRTSDVFLLIAVLSVWWIQTIRHRTTHTLRALGQPSL